MSLDVYLTELRPVEVYEDNITHNLTGMARHADLYHFLWCPEEMGIKTASELIGPLREGLERLKADPDRFKAFNPPNGWGHYDNLVAFVDRYLKACEAAPLATVRVSR
jgi:hypothetical protein